MQTPEPDPESRDFAQTHHHGQHECLDWCPICRGAELIKASVPPELADQLHVVQRDILLLVQALVEAQLARIREQQEQAARAHTPADPGVAPDTGPDGDDLDVTAIPID